MRLYTRLADVPPSPHGRLVTVGTFDGVHRGHQALLRRLRELSALHRLPACVVTFEPHPQQVLGNTPLPGILTPLPEKLERLRRLGPDEVLVLPFTQELARTEPETFIRQYLVEALHMRGILVGYDHRFGHNRRGDRELLQRLGTEFGFFVEHFPPCLSGNEPISSSRIRRLLLEGNVEAAAVLLGYPYTVCGRVVRGDGRGRLLGFPTANIVPDSPEKLLPAYGVYIATTEIGSKSYGGLLSYGVRPTFGQNLPPQLELYVLDFSGTLYNERLCVSFWKRVRAEEAFPTAAALRRQMQADEAYCRQWLAQHRPLEAGLTSSCVLNADQGTES
ncbi:Riboflavin biosynthesis protein RibF [bacterium HR21]|nr:Riboflavin biosynthesis protein RibF [bacterium HR21]